MVADTNVPLSKNNGILRADRSCLGWFDDQPLESVVYLSFGSLVVITRDQVMDFLYLVEWAPQEGVLAHPAIGCFPSYDGWNSTLGGRRCRVPVICWPRFAVQMVNITFVGHVWRNGVDVKDTRDAVVVERVVRDLIDPERDNEFRYSAEKMAKLVRTSSGFGGSSYRHRERLIMDIKHMAAHQNRIPN
ncbi:myricetin 3-O-rhamnoside 1,2-glucosyltransferase UGT709G2-like [Rhodamnia argentea]|uniref:Myricetin 3-O-rhamnoside 1,2-glucosyltransferase UGT709G2-like n=1 Tax=Rhodamnia argentea TaxID=178133 RepID=A0A8B8NVJ0_9MYRT|nr:myricetin 3-O-rhamnoside 1,2-glucosyltransferase UGT709G2-like [Rhodamnia argentea]